MSLGLSPRLLRLGRTNGFPIFSLQLVRLLARINFRPDFVVIFEVSNDMRTVRALISATAVRRVGKLADKMVTKELGAALAVAWAVIAEGLPLLSHLD